MESYLGTYKVVNLDWRQSLPEIFDNFEDAFKAQQDWDLMAHIVQLFEGFEEIVWSPEYENVLGALS